MIDINLRSVSRVEETKLENNVRALNLNKIVIDY
jgi:hypothetical protein